MTETLTKRSRGAQKSIFDFALCPPLKMPTPKIPPWPDQNPYLCSHGGQQTMATMALSSSDLPGIVLALSGNIRILKARFFNATNMTMDQDLALKLGTIRFLGLIPPPMKPDQL